MAKRLFQDTLNWGQLLEILSYLTLTELYRGCGCLNRASWVVFLRERASRQCPRESLGTGRFLSQGWNHEKVVLVSYPRSGNSFLRRLLETRFGIITGSDSRPNRTLTESLLRCGFRGEGICDDSVWIVKTHYPERLGYRKFPATRVILLVRNPFDAIESYFHMGMTNTHNKNLAPSAWKRLRQVWPQFVAHEAGIWAKFHEFWLEVSRHIPVLTVRYEDLLGDTERIRTLASIEAFMTDGCTVDSARDSCGNGGDVRGTPAAPPVCWKRLRQQGIPSNADGVATVLTSTSTTTITPKGDMITTGGAIPNGDPVVGGPGYLPKQGGIGKGLRLLDDTLVEKVLQQAGHIMQMYQYTYIPTTVESTGDPLHDSSSSNGNSCSPNAKRFKETCCQEEDALLSLTHLATGTATTIPPPLPPPPTTIISTPIATTTTTTSATVANALTTTAALLELDVHVGMSVPPTGMLIVSPIPDNANLDSTSLLRAFDTYKNNKTTTNTTGAIVADSSNGRDVDVPFVNTPTMEPPIRTVPIIGVHDDYVIINEAYSIRDADDSFGRLMTDLRKSFTQNDLIPFETTK